MELLDGKLISAILKKELAKETRLFIEAGGKRPHLVAILVGHTAASEVYVASKMRSCEETGFKSTLIRFEETVSEAELLSTIDTVNSDTDVDGILVQLPLPGHISVEKVTWKISPEKDVDGFHPMNIGRMAKNLPCYLPATPLGILKLLEAYKIETEGKHCVVLGRSYIVGSPVSILMARAAYPGNCTVTLCHSKTKHMDDIIRSADILIAAIGKPQFVTDNMVKQGVVVIDVGMNRIADSTTKSGTRLVGDVDFAGVAPKSSFITPVPGGVGLMTIVGLLQNTFSAAKKEIYG